MQIAPTALISFSISTNVTALQACYGFTMGWVINFCELHIRHLIMPFINKCHPRYLLGEVNKLNVPLSALCKSILTAHCIFSLVCLSRRMTTEITMANKGIRGTIIWTQKRCCSEVAPLLIAGAMPLLPHRAARTHQRSKAELPPKSSVFKEFGSPWWCTFLPVTLTHRAF